MSRLDNSENIGWQIEHFFKVKVYHFQGYFVQMWISIVELTSQWGTAVRVFVHANPNNSKWGLSKDFDRFRQKPRRCENTAELVCKAVERVWSNCITKVLNERKLWNKGNITPRYFFLFFFFSIKVVSSNFFVHSQHLYRISICIWISFHWHWKP